MENKIDYMYFFNKIKFHFAGLLFTSILLSAFLIINTFLIKIVYDNILSTFEELLLIKISIAFFISIIFISIFKILKQIFIVNIKQKLLENFRLSLMDEFINYEYQYFIKKNSGEITKRIVEDSELVCEGFTKICLGISNIVIIIIWLILFFIFIKWIFFIYLILIFFLVIWFLIWKNPIGKTSYEIGLKYSKLYKLFLEIIPGIKLIKYELLHKYILNELNKITKKINKVFIKNTIFYNLLWNINSPLVWTINILILFFGVKELKKGNFTIGLLTVFFMLVWLLMEPIFEISAMIVCFQELKSAFKRINEYRTGIKEKSGNILFNKMTKNIKFSNIMFRYQDGNFYLKNINLNIEKGQSIAILGKTGYGKSTLINLLLRLYYPNSGEILFDNINISKINLKSLRDNIILVPQDINLYPFSLRKNIDLKEQLSDDEIHNLLKKLLLNELVDKLPYGLDTMIIENGINFSGGEKQRIGIARALALKSKFYIFDEITANLDPKTALNIINYVYNLGNDVTTITLTHDLKILSRMDKIYLLKNNTISKYNYNIENLQNEIIKDIY